MKIAPDFIARVTLFKPSEGGRESATPSSRFGCLLKFEESFYDVRMLLEKVGSLTPGETKDVPIKMLNKASVESCAQQGRRFLIWEGRDIGRGEIIEVS